MMDERNYFKERLDEAHRLMQELLSLVPVENKRYKVLGQKVQMLMSKDVQFPDHSLIARAYKEGREAGSAGKRVVTCPYGDKKYPALTAAEYEVFKRPLKISWINGWGGTFAPSTMDRSRVRKLSATKEIRR